MGSTIYLVGTGDVPGTSGGVGPPGTGPDGSADQKYNPQLGIWQQIALPILDGTGSPPTLGNFQGSSAHDPRTGLILCSGNVDSQEGTEYYNPKSNGWTITSNLASAAGGMGLGLAPGNDHFYVFGGGGSFRGPYNTICDLTISTGSWNTLTGAAFTLPNNALNMFGCILNGVMWIAGGSSNDDDPPATMTAFDYFATFDPVVGLTAKHAMPEGRASAGCIPFPALGTAGKILVVGGAVTNTPDNVGTSDVRIYDVAGNSWTSLNAYGSPGTARPVACGRGCNWNGTGFIAGGLFSTSFTQYSEVYKYSPGSDSWSLHSNLTYTVAGAALVVASDGLGDDPLFYGTNA